MATITQTHIDTTLKVTMELNESELRALDGIFGYDVEIFLKVFYEKMGSGYVRAHESGVRSLHKTIRSACAGPLMEITRAKLALREALKKSAQ